MSSVELIQALGMDSKEAPGLLHIVHEKALALSVVLDQFLNSAKSIPVAAKDDALFLDEKPQVSAPGLKALPKRDRKILIVDDNFIASKALGQLLEFHGYTVETARDGSEGLKKALAFQPDVAILDISMPRMDGYELSERMHTAGIKSTYIALTGYGQAHHKARASEAGFDFHLTKPIPIKDILSLLERVDSK